MKSIRSTFLLTMITFSIVSPTFCQEKTWGKTLGVIAVGAVVNTTLAAILQILFRYLTKEYNARKKIQNLIFVNKELKNQIDYAKENFYDRKLIREMEKQYKLSCLKIIQIQKEYFEKYTKKI